MKKLSNRGKVTLFFMVAALLLIALLAVIESNYPTVNLHLREELLWITDLI